MIVDEAMNEKGHHKRIPLKHPYLNPQSLKAWLWTKLWMEKDAIKEYLSSTHISTHIHSGMIMNEAIIVKDTLKE